MALKEIRDPSAPTSDVAPVSQMEKLRPRVEKGCSAGRPSLHLSLPPRQAALHPNPTLWGQGPAASALAMPSPLPLRAKSLWGAQWCPQDLCAQGRDQPNRPRPVSLLSRLITCLGGSPRRPATEGRQEQETVPSMENSEEKQPQEKRGLWRRP